MIAEAQEYRGNMIQSTVRAAANTVCENVVNPVMKKIINGQGVMQQADAHIAAYRGQETELVKHSPKVDGRKAFRVHSGTATATAQARDNGAPLFEAIVSSFENRAKRPFEPAEQAVTVFVVGTEYAMEAGARWVTDQKWIPESTKERLLSAAIPAFNSIEITLDKVSGTIFGSYVGADVLPYATASTAGRG